MGKKINDYVVFTFEANLRKTGVFFFCDRRVRFLTFFSFFILPFYFPASRYIVSRVNGLKSLRGPEEGLFSAVVVYTARLLLLLTVRVPLYYIVPV